MYRPRPMICDVCRASFFTWEGMVEHWKNKHYTSSQSSSQERTQSGDSSSGGNSR